MQPQTFVFFGIVGSGKGTQVKLLQEYLKSKDSRETVYIGTGEIFRKMPEVKEITNAGKLVPDEMTNRLVAEALDKEPNLAEKNLVFDGYPRTVGQSNFFENLVKRHGRDKVKIIYIELSEGEAMKRNLLRGRHDDTEAGLRKRFEEYKNNVVPAMAYFKGKPGYEILAINGEQSVEDVHKDIIAALGI